MKKVLLEQNEYDVIENINECFNIDEIKELYTDYFNDYDYILGDYAYNKLRLKGFCDKTNKKYNKINDIIGKDKYLKEQCAFNCRYFVLKKVKNT